MTRAEKHAEIIRLRGEGLTDREIAPRLGLARKTVHQIIYDPDGSKQKARRVRYQGVCEDCGAATDGSGGYGKAPRFCHSCYPEHVRVWTREAIIAAIQKWAAEHGRTPTAREWMRSGNDHPTASNCVYNDHPSMRGNLFKSWNDAIEAAGFTPRRSGERTPEGQARVTAAVSRKRTAA